jgi:hypothetical protein
VTPLEERVALEQAALEAVWAAVGAVDDALPVLRRLEELLVGNGLLERVSRLLEVRDALEGVTEGVEGWTGCYTCERVVIPVVEGVADVDCEECEV